jgi:HK97 family phage major capsid protein
MPTATYEQLAANARARIDTLTAQRQVHADTILRIRAACDDETRDPNEAEAEQVRAAATGRDELDEQIEDLRQRAEEYDREGRHAVQAAARARQEGAPDGDVRVTSEPDIYNPGNAREGRSLIRDMYASMEGDDDARDRVRQHRTAMQALRGADQRAATTSSFAGIIPPQYLVDLAALAAVQGRPLANTVNRLPLPAEGMSLVIPRETTTTAEGIQTAENTVVATQDEVWTNLTVPVVTIAGHAPISRQAIERGMPGMDQLIFADLAAQYAKQLDSQVIAGTGSSGQMFGILNTSGVVVGTAFGAAVTATTFLTKIAGAINQVETTRFLPPDVIYMHPRRWNWLTQTVDSQSRPLVTPVAQGPMNALGTFEAPQSPNSQTPQGYILGLPVITDPNLPTSQGTGPEDVVFVARRADLLLWENDSPNQLRFDQTLGTQLTVELVLYNYAAFTAGRYPTAVAQVGGNAGAGFGLITPTF